MTASTRGEKVPIRHSQTRWTTSRSDILKLAGLVHLLDNLTAANRDFVDEKLIGIRSHMRDLEAQQQELESVADGPLDAEAATTQALAHVARLREVLEQGSIVQQKEFLKGMIADITLYPSKNRGVVRYY